MNPCDKGIAHRIRGVWRVLGKAPEKIKRILKNAVIYINMSICDLTVSSLNIASFLLALCTFTTTGRQHSEVVAPYCANVTLELCQKWFSLLQLGFPSWIERSPME